MKERLFAKDTVTKQTLKSNPMKNSWFDRRKKSLSLVHNSYVNLLFGDRTFVGTF